jgi:ceramide glucosyltransferase
MIFLLTPSEILSFHLSSLSQVSLLFLFLSLTAISYYCIATYTVLEFFSHPIELDVAFSPPLSVLKPLCGLEDNTYKNLASFCQQDYPSYQIIFAVQDRQDPCLATVKQLIHDFPELDLRLVVNNRTIGANLKVSNLDNAIAEAQHDILVLADSDILVGPDYLRRIIQPLHNSNVGVVTCMYRSLPQGQIAAFEALSTATEFLPSVLVARKLEGMTFALGATVVIRKAVLEAIGGFSAVANYLEDDFCLGNMPAQTGYEVVLSDYVVGHVMSSNSIAELIHHQTRWARGTRFARPWGYIGLVFTHGTVSSLLFWLTTGGSMLGWAVLSITWSVRLALAWIMGAKYLHDPATQQGLWLVPLRDLISFALWCYSFIGNTVEWRGRRLRLTKGGRLVEFS